MLERWHCSFDELISKHTEGQIVMLTAGCSIWKQIENIEIKRQMSESEKDNKHSISGKVKGRVRDLRPPKEAMESADAYEKWMRSVGYGQAIKK